LNGEVPTAQAEQPAGAVVFGQYHILELIGAGGMAEVYRASSVGPGGFVKPVVIKRVKPKHARDPGFISMFVDEAKLSARLQHPNIVTVFEFGEIDGHHYIAMEYIDGLHLQAIHVRHTQLNQQPLPWQAGALIARDMLLGLDYAHEVTDEKGAPLSLVHRDINLVNVMVGSSGVVKILDFGIVKAAGGVRSAETMGGVLKGKFGYMSPEQAEGKPLDRRSDVFSASIVLHELLTGRRLFWGEDDLAILRKVCAGEIVDPRSYRPDLPEALVAVTMKGLARRLDDRYATAGVMAEALDVVIAENGVSDGTLRKLMEELLPPQPSEASETMRHRRQRVTLMAWSGGVKDADAPSPVVSGVLGIQDAKSTSAGKRSISSSPQEGEGDPAEGAPIVQEPRWLVPEAAQDGDPHAIVLGEQDTTVVTETPLGDDAVDGATVILSDGDDGDGQMSAVGALTSDAGQAGAPVDLALAGAETRIIDQEDAKGALVDLALAGAETRIIDQASDMPLGEPAVGEPAVAAPPESSAEAPMAASGKDEPNQPRRRGPSKARVVLAVTLVAALAALVILLFLRS
jgi:serine/threonine protein kinase